MEYNRVIIGFVVQSYRDGECVRQEFIASDEVSREDPATGESIEVDVNPNNPAHGSRERSRLDFPRRALWLPTGRRRPTHDAQKSMGHGLWV